MCGSSGLLCSAAVFVMSRHVAESIFTLCGYIAYAHDVHRRISSDTPVCVSQLCSVDTNDEVEDV